MAKTYIALDVMDISLSEGDVVGVVIEKDPMGNKDRWFVDTGGIVVYILTIMYYLYNLKL